MSRTDLLCWYCKGHCSSSNFSCDRCRKSFHSDCHLAPRARGARTNEQLLDIYPIIHGPVPPEYVCPVCKLLHYADTIVYDKRFVGDMNRAMVHAVDILQKFDTNSIFLNPVQLEDYSTHVIEPKCLKDIREAAEKEKYNSVARFEADIRLIYHNSNVYNGSAEKAPITKFALNLMMEGVKQCAKIRYCSRCYWINLENDNYNLKGSEFVKPCDRPHGVAWAKNGDDDFALVKIVGFQIEKRTNKMVDVCFFGGEPKKRVVKTVRMEDCYTFCEIDAFEEFCKSLDPPSKVSVSELAKSEVSRYFENAKTIFKNDVPRILKRQQNKEPTILDEKHLYLTEFITEWDFTNETSDKDDRKNRLNRATEFTQFFIDPKIPKESKDSGHHSSSSHHKTETGGSRTQTQASHKAVTQPAKAEKRPKPESSSPSQPPKAEKKPKIDVSPAPQPPKAEKKPKVESLPVQQPVKVEKKPKAESTPTATSSSSRVQQSAPKAQRPVREVHSPQSSTSSKSSTKGKLPKEFSEIHNEMLKKREIYVNRVETFDRKRKNYNNAPGLYTSSDDAVQNEGSSDVTPQDDTEIITSLKDSIVNDVNEMDDNKSKIKEILSKYPEKESSHSINNWRKVILTLSDTALNGSRSMLKEVLHKEKVPALKSKCEFYETVRQHNPPDRREVCDNCLQAANYFHPVDNKYRTFCEQKCAEEFIKKRLTEDL